MTNSLATITDLDRREILEIITQAQRLKAELKSRPRFDIAQGMMAVLLFEKPSLRTRVTFEKAMRDLGGSAIYLGPQEVGMGTRESVPDIAANLSRWVDCIIARVFEHTKIVQLVEHATVPVINALSDHEHPCQILADLLTVYEHSGRLEGVTICWTGDGNNVCNSLMLACGLCGVNLRVATPRGFEPPVAVTTRATELARASGSQLLLTYDPKAAADAADYLYTDVWASMGQENEAEQRRQIFRPYQLNSELLRHAKPDARVLHCLPAHRGEEITSEVLDGPQALVLEQAENRLHAQRALLARLLAGRRQF